MTVIRWAVSSCHKGDCHLTTSLPQVAETNPPWLVDAAGEGSLYDLRAMVYVFRRLRCLTG
jgi:hypothetical protein